MAYQEIPVCFDGPSEQFGRLWARGRRRSRKKSALKRSMPVIAHCLVDSTLCHSAIPSHSQVNTLHIKTTSGTFQELTTPLYPRHALRFPLFVLWVLRTEIAVVSVCCASIKGSRVCFFARRSSAASACINPPHPLGSQFNLYSYHHHHRHSYLLPLAPLPPPLSYLRACRGKNSPRIISNRTPTCAIEEALAWPGRLGYVLVPTVLHFRIIHAILPGTYGYPYSSTRP
ncbi:hypothetical protein B0H66DRAFT_135221 [Apodospora peruviana]|uniref:Uncharacterized protein n=1 Tax=Apodospora peruviana TaxID=516989 RepID=A0AAE0MBK6_9PEZI|nr:hypothetical protein B0H66DRAFT_135221 [Apodospora peruviana]